MFSLSNPTVLPVLPQKLIDKALRDYAATKNAKAVVKRTGLSLTSVYRILEAHGIERVGLDLYRRRARKLPADEQVLAEYKRGDSLSQIAERYRCTDAAVARVLKKRGATMRPRGNSAKIITREEAETMAAHYAELGSQQAVAALMETNQSRVSTALRLLGIRCGTARMRGSLHPTWRGGRTVADGYVKAWVDPDDPLRCMAGTGGYALEHRLVMARALGRPLSEHETVHHINGDRADNRLSNLQLRFGKHGKGVSMVCAKCGSNALIYKEIIEQ